MTPDFNIILPEILRYLVQQTSDACETNDSEKAYMLALGSLVNILLTDDKSTCREQVRAQDLNFPALDAISVGLLYERLRNFRFAIGPSGTPELMPCSRAKRNQGLFYTPSAIVKYIVECTLDSLQVTDPAEYLNLKILDPAVGTGAFLVEAAEQLTARVRNAAGNKKVEAVISSLKQRFGDREGRPVPKIERETLIKIHIIENCLFGVDLDSIAVQIARAALLSRIDLPRSIYDVRTNILHGNSLKGESSFSNISASDLIARFPQKYLDSGSGGFFHWPIELPEVFENSAGFDAVIGNPPYEVLSVKESGISSRREEQVYFRRMFTTCEGKLNTYRLMMERSLQLMKPSGVLGFIVPATFLSDSTAGKLREMILDTTTVMKTVVMPEKAKIFPGVTQALMILITKKMGFTEKIAPMLWNGQDGINDISAVPVSRNVVRRMGNRVPLLKSRKELRLLECISKFPPFGGDGENARAGRIHQGEVNLTVHESFISLNRTDYPLVRGEHVSSLSVNHPCSPRDRMDWVLPEFLKERSARAGKTDKSRTKPWEKERIVVARVVNMDTEIRLKAALANPWTFLGDMTNYITEPDLPIHYMLGLLNSRLLNWRIKATSTNNYISAAELAALPIPRMESVQLEPDAVLFAKGIIDSLSDEQHRPIGSCIEKISTMRKIADSRVMYALISQMIAWIAEKIQVDRIGRPSSSWNMLDAQVIVLYGAESMLDVLGTDSGNTP